MLFAMAFISCGNWNEESEIELGEYNTDSLNKGMETQKPDSVVTDTAVVDSTKTDTATTN